MCGMWLPRRYGAQPPGPGSLGSGPAPASLVAVALGLVTFGVYSCCEVRWRKVRPG